MNRPKINVKSYLATAVLAMLPMLSQASVVYEWEATSNLAPRNITFWLEFDDATAKAGSFDFETDGYEMGDVAAWLPKNSGLISLSFGFPGATGVTFTQDEGNGNIGTYHRFLKMHVTLGEFMTGAISAGNFETGFTMAMLVLGNEFTITELVSDAMVETTGCKSPQVGPCAGATGVIRRVNEVPEPSSLALIGAGLFAASRIRRRKAL